MKEDRHVGDGLRRRIARYAAVAGAVAAAQGADALTVQYNPALEVTPGMPATLDFIPDLPGPELSFYHASNSSGQRGFLVNPGANVQVAAVNYPNSWGWFPPFDVRSARRYYPSSFVPSFFSVNGNWFFRGQFVSGPQVLFAKGPFAGYGYGGYGGGEGGGYGGGEGYGYGYGGGEGGGYSYSGTTTRGQFPVDPAARMFLGFQVTDPNHFGVGWVQLRHSAFDVLQIEALVFEEGASGAHVYEIPEPSSLALLAAGAAGVAALRRRRRKAPEAA